MKHIITIIISGLTFFACSSEKNHKKMLDADTTKENVLQTRFERTVKYLSGKDTVLAYFSLPQGEGAFPSVILVHEWWGLNDWIKDNADKFAKRGYAALAIDLYRGKSTVKLNEAQQLTNLLSKDRIIQDIQAAVAFLSNHNKVDKNKIGIVGWGTGGENALYAATKITTLKAAVINYGSIITDQAALKKITCPILGIFGETDREIPVMDVQNFEQVLKDANKQNKIIIYRNVGHAFMYPNNKEGYNSEITERAWREIFAFLEQHLKS